MTTLIVKPAANRRVLNHQREFRPLATDGEQVTVDRDVRRWLASGDVVVAAPAPAADVKKKAVPSP